VRLRKHTLVAVPVACLVAASLAGCGAVQGMQAQGVTRAVSQANAFTAANKAAPGACSKAHAEAIFATATYAFYAADQLRKAGLDPQPWADMPPTAIIYQCYGNPPTGNGLYVDSMGRETIAPPEKNAPKCKITSTSSGCSSAIDFASP
jgi:hypothetical protein